MRRTRTEAAGPLLLLLLGLGAAPSTASADPLAYYTVPTTDGSELWQLDLELPVGYPIAPLGLPDSAVTALAFSADGRLYAADYAAGGRLLTIDPATGAATVVGGFGLPAPQVGVFYLTGDACGRLWAAARVGVPGLEPSVVAGEAFRAAVGTTVLRSTAFSVRKRGDRMRFTGRGYGHGVGMCVIGAGRRALQRAYPRLPFAWAQDGTVFLLRREELG